MILYSDEKKVAKKSSIQTSQWEFGGSNKMQGGLIKTTIVNGGN